jgi:5-methylcytosine-specific restriction endonuclease McrBC regulatory subunit McrC
MKPTHKTILKEESLQVINENFRDVSRHGQPKCTGGTQEIPRGQKYKENEKTQKQINEIIETLNKCQTETETTTNREINELR